MLVLRSPYFCASFLFPPYFFGAISPSSLNRSSPLSKYEIAMFPVMSVMIKHSCVKSCDFKLDDHITFVMTKKVVKDSAPVAVSVRELEEPASFYK